MKPHIPRKRFGQHFLCDQGIIESIVQAIAPRPGDAMVEIGPGLAALTQPLVERLGRLTVIELDRDLALRLRLHGQLDVIESDVLKVDFTALAHTLRDKAGQRHNGLHDAVDDALVGQEMLPEALAGNVFHAIGSLMSSICRATACELCKGRDPDQQPPRKGRPAALAASPFP